MGLDVYVGTLTRYLAGTWELAAERAASEAGVQFAVVRTNPPADDAITDEETIRDAVFRWRSGLAGAIGYELEWPETDDVPYFTEKPDWSGYWALLMLAGHEEHPELPLPETLPNEPVEHPLFELVSQSLRSGYRRADPPRYAAIYSPELWLPVEVDGVWQAPFVTGDVMTMGSLRLLLRSLRDLAARVGAGADELAAWRANGGGPTFLDFARFALSTFLGLAERAAEHRLPLKLDY